MILFFLHIVWEKVHFCWTKTTVHHKMLIFQRLWVDCAVCIHITHYTVVQLECNYCSPDDMLIFQILWVDYARYTLHIVQRTLHSEHCTVVQLDHRFLRFPTFTVCGLRAQRHLRLHRLSALFLVHSLVPFETCGEMKYKANILRSQLLSAPPICLQSYTLCLVCTSTGHFVHLSSPLVCGHCAPLAL